MIIDFEKKIGESMQDVIDRFKLEYKLNKLEKVAFAGRLDPIAFGKIRLLTGDDKERKSLECLHDKIYTYSVIESFQTDTYDILGELIKSETKFVENIFTEPQTILQPYPLFSSKTVEIDKKMIRLWDATKKNLITESTIIPTKLVTIFYNKKIKEYTVNGSELYEMIQERINTVKGDFRQENILKLWEKNIDLTKKYNIKNYQTKISSGGYVRSIAHSMGSVAFDICRINYI